MEGKTWTTKQCSCAHAGDHEALHRAIERGQRAPLDAETAQRALSWVAANAPAYHYGYDHRGEYEYCGNNICVEARSLLAI